MKEATGQLNSTLVVVLAVGVLSAFFYFALWPGLKSNMEYHTKCSKAICDKCPKDDSNGKLVSCYYCDDKGTPVEITCTWHDVKGKNCDPVPRKCTKTTTK